MYILYPGIVCDSPCNLPVRHLKKKTVFRGIIMIKKLRNISVCFVIQKVKDPIFISKTYRSDSDNTNPDLIGHGSESDQNPWPCFNLLQIYILCLSLSTLTFLICVQNCSQGRNSPESHSCSKFLHLFAFPGTLNVYFATGGE
jgi:hypothetical protein